MTELDLYREVARIRALELLLNRYINEHGFGGFWHPGLGQEGIQAGAVSALREDDYLFYAHRGLGYALAKGMSPVTLLADLFGKTGGSVGGKGGGTVHFVDPGRGVLGQGGTVGSSFVLGAGAGVSAQMLGTDKVVAIFFGDGSSARGTWHEAALTASVWKLPLVWVCENNGWAISVPIGEQSPTENIADRASAYGVPGVIVDGQDTLAVKAAMEEAVARARAGEGPTLIEAKTNRVRGHFEGDKQAYREGFVESLEVPRDPLAILREDVPDEEADRLEAEASAEAEAALAEVLAMPDGDESVVTQGVWV
ncbi:MAG TPA: thiamine pyrophosphate-dependent dehydrogenase E1 component subunit alpha [Solirubrobacterales bacterium]|jgi:pyruvate dehydrogenase E1 component alpha subunit|nr:thiamine pyrophosphate-dependent dehydrogenase E1 component subunit alpha [Solirubrobacterales bacterium]